VPHPGLGAPWDGWCRYEAAINDLLDDVAIWSLCIYDRRITPEAVLADVERTHPHLLAVDGSHQRNDRYQDPTTFLRTMAPPPLDPLETGPPAVELVDPLPSTGRQAVRDIAKQTRLHDNDIDDLVTATSEAITNAIKHGRPPVTLRLWAMPERIVVTVNDQGDGPQDPHAGLVPRHDAANGPGGFGLWLIHQLTSAAAYTHDTDGFTIHLTGGQALPLHHDAQPGSPLDPRR
jgi:anti-sigma regulatory factor (Ser/Thr protein kinase)